MPNTHNLIVDFGKFKGERWTRLPISYLKWLINAGSQYAMIAQSELDRRGITDLGAMDISAHAIDRASLFCSKQWRETREKSEGLHSWLYRTAVAALKDGAPAGIESEGRIYEGMKFIFKFGMISPTLVTVMNLEERNQDAI